jgi:hypothetical protein
MADGFEFPPFLRLSPTLLLFSVSVSFRHSSLFIIRPAYALRAVY